MICGCTVGPMCYDPPQYEYVLGDGSRYNSEWCLLDLVGCAEMLTDLWAEILLFVCLFVCLFSHPIQYGRPSCFCSCPLLQWLNLKRVLYRLTLVVVGVCLFICLFVCLFVLAFVCVFVCLFVCLFVCFVCLFVCLFVKKKHAAKQRDRAQAKRKEKTPQKSTTIPPPKKMRTLNTRHAKETQSQTCIT